MRKFSVVTLCLLFLFAGGFAFAQSSQQQDVCQVIITWEGLDANPTPLMATTTATGPQPYHLDNWSWGISVIQAVNGAFDVLNATYDTLGLKDAGVVKWQPTQQTILYITKFQNQLSLSLSTRTTHITEALLDSKALISPYSVGTSLSLHCKNDPQVMAKDLTLDLNISSPTADKHTYHYRIEVSKVQ